MKLRKTFHWKTLGRDIAVFPADGDFSRCTVKWYGSNKPSPRKLIPLSYILIYIINSTTNIVCCDTRLTLISIFRYWPARILYPAEYKTRKEFAKRLAGQYSLEYFGSTSFYDNASRAIPLHLTTMDIFKVRHLTDRIPDAVIYFGSVVLSVTEPLYLITSKFNNPKLRRFFY